MSAPPLVSLRKSKPCVDLTYFDDNHIRSRLLEAAGGEALMMRSVESEDLETDGRVRVQATLMSMGRQDSLMEQIVSKLGLEPGVTAASWQVVAEHE